MTSNTNSAAPYAVILAGGYGTRLRSRVSDRPKALAEVAGKPFIAYQLEWLIKEGVTQASIAVHYMADQLQLFVDRWSDERLELDCIYEAEPLGTGGAVANVMQEKKIHGKILVMNGDTFFNFSLHPALERMQKSSEPALLIASMQDDVSRFGTIDIDGDFVFSFKQATGIHEPGLVNGGFYIVDSSLFRKNRIMPFSIEYDLFPGLARDKQLLVHVLDEKESFFDIGTPESYDQICMESEA
jgi:D-glycero-alpha-D-manno-heptose 1-phosphate guanylyltransferase